MMQPTNPYNLSSATNMKMIAAGIYYPKPSLHYPQGDDAHFICSEQQTLGVADGVGSWARKGINAGEYARELMQNAAFSVLRQPQGCVDPRAVLNEAFHSTKAEGSSTACIATLRKSRNDKKHHVLHAVNVGDSQFMIFRNRELFVRSPRQQHRFNKPYQLGNSEKQDKPESAMEFQIGVEGGDIVVFGTDGVFDNVYGSEIESVIVLKCGKESAGPEELAREIAYVALRNSMNRLKRSPFAEAAERAGRDHKGGKIDDITVVVAHIVSC